MPNTKIFSYLSQDYLTVELEASLLNIFINIDGIAGRRGILTNAGVDEYFINRLNFNSNINEFITSLVSQFKDYRVSLQNPYYHPLLLFSQYILQQPPQKYNLTEQDLKLFQKIRTIGGEQIKTLVTKISDDPNFSETNDKIDNYLDKVEEKLRYQGCLDFKYDVKHEEQQFKLVSKIPNFEIPFGVFNMRGYAFFIFSYLPSINSKILQQYSSQCLDYGKEKTTISSFGQVLNARVPSNVCFAIAIVKDLEPEIKKSIRTENPLDFETDTLWYRVPVVYCLSDEQLYFYDQPSSFWEKFKGEIVWKRLRQVVETTLNP
ncbi:hypothetical protein [Moorena sp. SIO3I8]|uniref:hypothetical protein n=1 Tax=Moorena sp. SIO3I8 TaxID=2607833 RepID=UPI0013C11A01|nr:hypothetical protein [Moorena sp. SIO3I8]NEO10245.1 hypothetical protein [Moorena sp. SIO3I8]